MTSPIWLGLALCVTLLVAGCDGGGGTAGSGSQSDASTAGTPRAAALDLARFALPPAKSRDEYLEEPRYSQADVQRGELLSLACLACHPVTPGEHNDLAPNLYGVFGRMAGSRPDFEYSAALRDSGIIWSPEALEAWMAGPEKMVPGTRMKFSGFQSEAARDNVVAYLLGKLGPFLQSDNADGEHSGQAEPTADSTANRRENKQVSRPNSVVPPSETQ